MMAVIEMSVAHVFVFGKLASQDFRLLVYINQFMQGVRFQGWVFKSIAVLIIGPRAHLPGSYGVPRLAESP